MHSKLTTRLLLAATVAGASMFAAMPARALDIGLVHLSNEKDEDYDGAVAFKKAAEAQSKGKIKVTIYSGGQLCNNATECMEALSSDLIQVFQSTADGPSNILPEINALDLPYFYRDDKVAECALGGALKDDVRDRFLKKNPNVRLMTIGNTGGWRNIATTSKQVKSPADFKGLKIRSTQAQTAQDFIRSLGGTPTPIAWPEVYTSLATNVVQGTMNSINDITSMKFHEFVKNMTIDRHQYMISFWWMNNGAYQKASADEKGALDAGFEALRQATLRVPKEREQAAFDMFTKAGGKLYTPTAEERAQFVKAGEGIVESFKAKNGDSLLNATRAAVSACEKS
jgi:TRAP-type transport system periplasmic protein